MSILNKNRKIVIINGNPATKRHSLCASLADAYAQGASESGGEVSRFDLKDLHFDPILHEGYEDDQPLESDLQRIRDAMVTCDHIVFIFPLWHGMPPALFKGFIDRSITRGFAFEYKNGKWPTATDAFKGKSAEIIITCSMPSFLYRWFSGAHASRALTTILKMCGIKVSRVTAFGLVSAKGDAAKKRFAGYISRAKGFGNAEGGRHA
jgi:NAD(P)H dehydrogenase (quinone)